METPPYSDNSCDIAIRTLQNDEGLLITTIPSCELSQQATGATECCDATVSTTNVPSWHQQ